jgi:L-ascorbate 6-phosphate lactonase
MTELWDTMAQTEVPPDAAALWWLGQAGFAIKTPAGKVIYVDPYLSDAVERLFGFKRLSLPAIRAQDVRADMVIITHEHADHLDPDALPTIARNNPRCRFAAPLGCGEGLGNAGIAPDRRILLEPGREHRLDGITVHAVPADHGDLSPTALGLTLDFGAVRILVTGDTAFHPSLFEPLFDRRPDLVLPCINGVFGNMNHLDAARFVAAAKPRFAIPCHYWTFAEQGGCDPAGFIFACKAMSPQTQALLLRPGETFFLTPAKPEPRA